LILAAIVLLVMVWAVRALEPDQDEYPAVIKLCNSWLEKNDAIKARESWQRTIGLRIHVMADELDISMDAAADRIINEYLTDIKSELDEKQPDKLTAKNRLLICRWIMLYAIHEWQLDPEIRARLTVKNFQRWIEGAA
jgi:hypothetical protein